MSASASASANGLRLLLPAADDRGCGSDSSISAEGGSGDALDEGTASAASPVVASFSAPATLTAAATTTVDEADDNGGGAFGPVNDEPAASEDGVVEAEWGRGRAKGAGGGG